MKKVKLFILLHFLVLGYYGLVFMKSVILADTLRSGLNFTVLTCITFLCLGLGWLHVLKRTRGRSGPYGGIRTGSFSAQVWMVRTHITLVLSSLVYLNIFLATIALLVITGHLHISGVFSPVGFFISLKLGNLYLDVKRDLVYKRNKEKASLSPT